MFEGLLKDKQRIVPTMKEVNDASVFTLPNFLNMNYCKFIRFGEQSISQVIGQSTPNYYIKSLMH